MERHKCKLCTRTFANGRALGGHMKAHLATLPPPPKATAATATHHQLGFRTESSSSSYSSSGEELEIDDDEDKEKAAAALAYRLRENPKKSFRFADPEFSFAVDAGSVVQDRESETESRNPTRRRSKRTRKSDFGDSLKQNFELKKLKLKVDESPPPFPPPPAATEPEPVSSVSDTSPEEDVAMCLMMLSRDVWLREEDDEDDDEEEMKQRKNREKPIEIFAAEKEIKVSKIRSGKFRCDKCMKMFRSSPALLTHKKICSLNGTELRNSDGNERIFECPYCLKVFGSGQALGGHKRSHLRNLDSSTAAADADAAAAANANVEASSKMENNWIDLNLPAPMEEDEFSSVVSDA